MKQVSSYYKIMAIMIVFFVFVSFGFSSTGIEVNKSSGLLSFFYNPFGYLFSMFKTDSSIDSNIVVNDDASFVLQTFGYCGDGVCNADENSLTCPEDCGLPPSYCGDGVCNADENSLTCPEDCGLPPSYCGDGVCNADENSLTCPEDCGLPPSYCGDGVCDPDENSLTCPEDCGLPPSYCGDGVCDPDENSLTCPEDCGEPMCQPGSVENVSCGWEGYTGPPLGECRAGTKSRVCNELGIWDNWSECIGAIYPVPEVCDNKDNDCNGLIDDNLFQVCGITDVGECTFGTETCSAGSWVGCTAIFPKPEEPNGKDDDCDGIIDNDFQCLPGQTQSESCGHSNVGECKLGTKTRTCGTNGLWDVWGSCVGAVYPTDEICDNKDNNCNGVIDEDLTQTCGVSDVGECTFGTETCSAGSWVGCTAIFPKPEEPNGKDDDCDGIIDNDFQCLPGQTNSRECGYNNIGICKMGLETQVCSPLGLWGSWGTCIGAIYPREEVYNGLDDDCNGIIDDVAKDKSFESSLVFNRINVLPEPGRPGINPANYALVQVFVENQGTKTFEDVSLTAELMDYGSRTKRSRLTIKKGTTESYKLLLEVPWYTKLGYAWVKVVLSSDEGMRIKYVPVKIE